MAEKRLHALSRDETCAAAGHRLRRIVLVDCVHAVRGDGARLRALAAEVAWDGRRWRGTKGAGDLRRGGVDGDSDAAGTLRVACDAGAAGSSDEELGWGDSDDSDWEHAIVSREEFAERLRNWYGEEVTLAI